MYCCLVSCLEPFAPFAPLAVFAIPFSASELLNAEPDISALLTPGLPPLPIARTTAGHPSPSFRVRILSQNVSPAAFSLHREELGAPATFQAMSPSAPRYRKERSNQSSAN